jgi:hypothetical protein
LEGRKRQLQHELREDRKRKWAQGQNEAAKRRRLAESRQHERQKALEKSRSRERNQRAGRQARRCKLRGEEAEPGLKALGEVSSQELLDNEEVGHLAVPKGDPASSMLLVHKARHPAHPSFHFAASSAAAAATILLQQHHVGDQHAPACKQEY